MNIIIVAPCNDGCAWFFSFNGDVKEEDEGVPYYSPCPDASKGHHIIIFAVQNGGRMRSMATRMVPLEFPGCDTSNGHYITPFDSINTIHRRSSDAAGLAKGRGIGSICGLDSRVLNEANSALSLDFLVNI